MMKSQTFEERMESHEKNQNAHVITKRNEDYYATSKVIIDKYDLKRYAKKKNVVKTFENLRRELTYQSLEENKNVEVKFMQVGEKYDTHLRSIYTVKITEDVSDITKGELPNYVKNNDGGKPRTGYDKEMMENLHRRKISTDIHQSEIDKIRSVLPKGFELYMIQVSREDYTQSGYLGGKETVYDNMITEISFEKKNLTKWGREFYRKYPEHKK